MSQCQQEAKRVNKSRGSFAKEQGRGEWGQEPQRKWDKLAGAWNVCVSTVKFDARETVTVFLKWENCSLFVLCRLGDTFTDRGKRVN